MKAVAMLSCPGCELSFGVTFKKPGFMGKTVVTQSCPGCKSTLQFIIERGRPDPNHPPVLDSQVSVRAKMIKMGDALKDALHQNRRKKR